MRRHVPFLAIALCGALLGAVPGSAFFDFKLLDLQFALLRAWWPKPAAHDVVVIGIDEETARRLPEPITLWHRHFGGLFTALAQARPTVVGVDIVLPDRSFESVLPGSDRELMKGLLNARRSYPLVLALTLDPAGGLRTIYPPFVTAAGPGSTGYALFPVDADSVVRRFDERLGISGEVVPTIVGQMARRVGLDPGAGLIDYSRGGRFDYVPLHQALSWIGEGNAAFGRTFGGKAVLIGTVLPYTDRLPTPVRLVAWNDEERDTPGVLLHAQALRNVLGGEFIQRAPAVAVAGLAGLAGLLWFVTCPMAVAIGVIALLAAALLAASTGLVAAGWFVPVLVPLVTAAAALGGRNGYEAFLKLKERRRLRASLGGYVSPSVMDEILAGRLKPELGGGNRFVCVMFSDIRGYTTRSERMTPEEVIRFLNRYFDRVVALIHGRGGSVVSFMGDGIMAVFGAPKSLENPCREAFETARAMLDFVTELNRQLAAEGVVPVEIGVGLNAGEAVIGHVGSSALHAFTAIGDVTNVASRVEGLTKEAGYHVVVTKAVADRLEAVSGLHALGSMAIKGHTPVDVYGYDRANREPAPGAGSGQRTTSNEERAS